MLEDSPISDHVKILGYRSHDQSVAWLKSADLLFLPLHTPLDGDPALIVPGKAYEYLGARRPILAMGPPGDMRNFIRDTNTGLTASIDPYGRVVARLERKTRAPLTAPYAPTKVTTFYSRLGDWFAFLCAIISTGALIVRFTPRKTEP